ncbi:MAG: hypothetical protein HZRFUVUK_001713 [Candidatus Fervidibacterota bacterium]|jgi:uncharacterized protein with PIN domain
MALKFAADAMLGKLARWLRLLGYDVFYLPDADDETLLKIAKDENRILLTRDTQLLRRKDVPPFLLILSDSWQEQLLQTAFHFDLDLDGQRMTRCVECNELLEPVSKEEVRYEVPRYVYRTQSQFARCPKCKKVFWMGSHCERANKIIERIKTQIAELKSQQHEEMHADGNL